jgi:large conductance mechanosensitive channel
MFQEFFDFLKEYNVMSLAIGFIIGAASNSLVKSLVEDIIMPIFSPIFTKMAWKGDCHRMCFRSEILKLQ